MVVEELIGGRLMEFSYIVVIWGGISTLFSILLCDSILYKKTPYRTGLGDINWEVVMFNMAMGGSTVYFIASVSYMVTGQGDTYTPWIAVSMGTLAILIFAMLLFDANARAKKSMETKQMWKDFNKWLIARGKSTDDGFINFINNTIDEVRPDMEYRMENPTYSDLKEFSQEKYPDFYKYLLRMEGIEG